MYNDLKRQPTKTKDVIVFLINFINRISFEKKIFPLARNSILNSVISIDLLQKLCASTQVI